MAANAKVDAYLKKAPEYAKPICKKLRTLIRKADKRLEETVKWGAPTYEHNGLVCSFHAFKNYVGFWFHKGALLKDSKKKLLPGVTAHTMKNIKIASPKEIDERAFAALVKEATNLNAKGVKVKVTKKKPPPPPPDLKRALAKNKKAKAIYEKFPPSHKREYVEWILEAKKRETREKRVKETVNLCARGKSKNWKYM